MKNYNNAFTVLEILLTFVAIIVLIVFYFNAVKTTAKFRHINEIADEEAIYKLSVAIAAYETIDQKSLLDNQTKPGFYIICNAQTADCSQEKGYISLQKLVDENYVFAIPTHSKYSDHQKSGYVLHYNYPKHNTVIMTYGDWEALGKPR